MMTTAAPGNHSALRYRTIDLLVVVSMGLIAGVAFFAYAAGLGALKPVFSLFPPSEGIAAGPWALPAALSMLIVRKPGSALGTMWIGAIIEALLGSHFGWTVLISGAIVAIGFEVMGAATKYAKPSFKWVLAGAWISMVLQWIWEQFVFFPSWAMPFRFAHLALFIISGVILLALPAPTIVRALAKTGALGNFAPGREEAAQR